MDKIKLILFFDIVKILFKILFMIYQFQVLIVLIELFLFWYKEIALFFSIYF